MSRLILVFKRSAVGLALFVVVLLLVSLTFSWWAGRRLERRLGMLRAAGEPTRFADLAPQPIPPVSDAAVFLSRASAELEAFDKEHAVFFRSPVGEAFRTTQQPTAEQIAAIGVILAHYPNLPQALEQAAACEGYTSRIDFSVGYPQMMDELMQPTQAARTGARFLRWRITVLLADGKQEEALEAGLAILRLARLYEGEPAMVNGLVSIAIGGIGMEGINRALRAGPISSALRQRLDDEITRQDDPQSLVRLMRTERAINIGASQGLLQPAFWIPWVGTGLTNDTIELHDRLAPLWAQPWHESHDQIELLANGGDLSASSFAAMLLPALLTCHEAKHRSIALLRALRIVNRLTAHAQQSGLEASSLDDLDLPASSTLDPFSGEPLKFNWTDEGWVVYSVFKDGADNGGDFKEMADVGLGPAGYPGPNR